MNSLKVEICMLWHTVIQSAQFIPNGSPHTFSNIGPELLAFVKRVWRRFGCRLRAASRKDGTCAPPRLSLVKLNDEQKKVRYIIQRISNRSIE